MKQKFLLATLLAILIKGILIYIAIHESNKEDRSWQMLNSVHLSEDVLGESQKYLSPLFHVESIYKSMKGPVSGHEIQIDTMVSDIVWITGYSVQAMDKHGSKQISDDFVCHNNIDFNLEEHHRLWKTPHRIDDTYPRLITLTQGQTSLNFPKGFGFPVFTNEPLYILTQVLNHNIANPDISIKHMTKIDYVFNKSPNLKMKPLFERSVFIMLPFDESNSRSGMENSKLCVPVDPNNHRYEDSAGMVYSGHWVVEPGKSTYTYDVTDMMNLPFDTRAHYIGVHTHPFAESMELKNIDLDSIVFKSECVNYTKKTGLKSIGYFSDTEGIPVNKSHHYALSVNVNNTSGEKQDMMASMFLYFYDPVIDSILDTYFENKEPL